MFITRLVALIALICIVTPAQAQTDPVADFLSRVEESSKEVDKLIAEENQRWQEAKDKVFAHWKCGRMADLFKKDLNSSELQNYVLALRIMISELQSETTTLAAAASPRILADFKKIVADASSPVHSNSESYVPDFGPAFQAARAKDAKLDEKASAIEFYYKTLNATVDKLKRLSIKEHTYVSCKYCNGVGVRHQLRQGLVPAASGNMKLTKPAFGLWPCNQCRGTGCNLYECVKQFK